MLLREREYLSSEQQHSLFESYRLKLEVLMQKISTTVRNNSIFLDSPEKR